MEGPARVFLRVGLILCDFPRVHVPRTLLQALPAEQRWHAVHEQVLGRLHALLLEHLGEALLLALGLGRHKRLAALLSDQLDLGVRGVADRQQGDGVGLVHDGQAGVVAADVTLPVRVVGDVAGGAGDRVVVGQRVLATRCGPAEVWVEGDAIRALRIDRKRAADALPDADGLEGLFLLKAKGARRSVRGEWARADWESLSDVSTVDLLTKPSWHRLRRLSLQPWRPWCRRCMRCGWVSVIVVECRGAGRPSRRERHN